MSSVLLCRRLGQTIFGIFPLCRSMCDNIIKDYKQGKGYEENGEFSTLTSEKVNFQSGKGDEGEGDFSRVGSEKVDFNSENGDEEESDFSRVRSEKVDFDNFLHDGLIREHAQFELLSEETDASNETDSFSYSSLRQRFLDDVKSTADKVFDILQQDGLGFDTRSALDEMQLHLSNRLVREVLIRISKSINHTNKSRCARLGYKFFVWSGQQKSYQHTCYAYNRLMKLFADCEEFKAMWKLVDDMTENGFATTARTLNILICTCGEAGMARTVVERFIKMKSFNYRPFKHSYNAILHSLLTINQYKLIEWVYQQMLLHKHSPDVLTYNVLLWTKFRLRKLDEFKRLLDEMDMSGICPDLHTFVIALHVLGRDNKPDAAQKLLNTMERVGCPPCVLHYTSLIDGLSRAGNMEACDIFFDQMVEKGCVPDVVSYTVMITGYIVAGELEKAKEMFDGMFFKGHLPNVYTYHSMIRGLCIAGKFEEALSMLENMQIKGCSPNFWVYSTLVGKLIRARKLSEANEVIDNMEKKGHYVNLISKFKGYRRC